MLAEAGWDGDPGELFLAVVEGRFVETTYPPGTDFQWIALRKKGKPIVASTELIQHLALCKFRAVENRVGVARAVNTGISAFIRPDGRVQQRGLAGTLPEDPRAREIKAGFLTDTVYVDSRTTIYNRLGDWFAIACTVLSAVLLFTPKK